MKQKGFTLIELLVATGIIVIISSIVLVDYRTGQKQFALERSAHKLAQDLRRAEEFSMSAKSYDCPGGFRIKGYGINFTAGNDYYLLKARCEDEANPGSYEDRTVESQIDLEKGVKILSVNTANVFFYPPEPEIDLGAAGTAQIILCLKTDIAKTETITVNKVGLINVQ